MMLGLKYLALAVVLLTQIALTADVPVGVILAKEQMLVRNNGTEPQSLDPNKIIGVPESNIVRDLFEGLVNTDPNGNIVPAVATNWEDDNHKIWRFFLRKDAKWSNGDPVTAHDFVYSWRRLVDPDTASQYAGYLQYAHVMNVDEIISGKKIPDTLGVKALDDYTLEITLNESIPYLLKLLAHSTLVPVHQKTIEQYGDRWTQAETIVGNGAYQLATWIVNERITLKRNPLYWDNAKTVIDEVTFLPITSPVTDLNFYRSGQSDIAGSFPLELFQKVKTELGSELHINPYLCTYFYEMNHTKPPFNDARVREAIKLSLDRILITTKVKNQGEIIAYELTPPFTSGMQANEPKWQHWTVEQRNQRAVALLQAAGYNEHNPLTFTFLYNTLEAHKKIAIALASQWKKLGIKVNLMNLEWKTYLDYRQEGKYEMAWSGWCADYDEPSSFLNIMISDNPINRSGYKSAEFDALMRARVQATTEEARAEIYRQAEAQLDKDSALAPIYHYVTARLVKPYVGGYTGKDPLHNIYTKDLYMIEH